MVRSGSMSYSVQNASSPRRTISTNSGAQYATSALGVGLIALGIVMLVWSVVPAGSGGNSSKPEPGQIRDTSSVAFVLTGGGIVLLLISVCLSVRNKQRVARGQEASNTPANTQEGGANQEQLAQSYMVPSYEEAVGSGMYPITQSSARNSTTQLPAYEELEENQQIEDDSSNSARRQSSQTDHSLTAGGRKNKRKLIPLKVRRIKSENLRRKSLSDTPQSFVFTIEPLTPPPQYDDKTVSLPPETHQ